MGWDNFLVLQSTSCSCSSEYEAETHNSKSSKDRTAKLHILCVRWHLLLNTQTPIKMYPGVYVLPQVSNKNQLTHVKNWRFRQGANINKSKLTYITNRRFRHWALNRTISVKRLRRALNWLKFNRNFDTMWRSCNCSGFCSLRIRGQYFALILCTK